MATIAEQLTAARKAKGMTQQGLARATGISRASIANWETGRRLPDEEMLRRLSEALGRPIGDGPAALAALPGNDAPTDALPGNDAPTDAFPEDDAPTDAFPEDDAPVDDLPAEDAPIDVPAGDAPGDPRANGAPASGAPAGGAPADVTVNGLPLDRSPVSGDAVSGVPAGGDPADVPVNSAPLDRSPVSDDAVSGVPAGGDPFDVPANGAPIDRSPVSGDAPVDPHANDAPAGGAPADVPVSGLPLDRSPVSGDAVSDFPANGSPIGRSPASGASPFDPPADDASHAEKPIREDPAPSRRPTPPRRRRSAARPARRRSRWPLAVITALTIATLALVAWRVLLPRLRDRHARLAAGTGTGVPAVTEAAFRQEDPNDPDRPFLSIAPALRTETRDGVEMWIYTLTCRETNGFALDIDRVESYAFLGDSVLSAAADREALLARGLPADIPPGGEWSVEGALPVRDDARGVGFALRGTDPSGAPLSFVGYLPLNG